MLVSASAERDERTFLRGLVLLVFVFVFEEIQGCNWVTTLSVLRSLFSMACMFFRGISGFSRKTSSRFCPPQFTAPRIFSGARWDLRSKDSVS